LPYSFYLTTPLSRQLPKKGLNLPNDLAFLIEFGAH